VEVLAAGLRGLPPAACCDMHSSMTLWVRPRRLFFKQPFSSSIIFTRESLIDKFFFVKGLFHPIVRFMTFYVSKEETQSG
jgi:hypothetical protein